jgi:hypothetical protein
MHQRVAACPCSHFVFSFERTERIIGRTALCHHGLCARPYRHLPRGSLCRFQIEIRVIITRRFLVFTVHPLSQPVSLLRSRQCPRRLAAPPHRHPPPSSTTGCHHPSPRQPEHPYVDHHLHYPPPLPRFATANYHFLSPSDGVPPPWLPSLGRPTPKQFGPCIAGHATNWGGGVAFPFLDGPLRLCLCRERPNQDPAGIAYLGQNIMGRTKPYQKRKRGTQSDHWGHQ